MQKYSSGRRGVPAKDVGRAYPAREFKSLLLRQKHSTPFGVLCFSFGAEGEISTRRIYGAGPRRKNG